MTKMAKALHPIKAGGKIIKPGGDFDVEIVGEVRFARLIGKGRASQHVGEVAEVNRADTQTGKPNLTLPPEKGKAGK